MKKNVANEVQEDRVSVNELNNEDDVLEETQCDSSCSSKNEDNEQMDEQMDVSVPMKSLRTLLSSFGLDTIKSDILEIKKSEMT